MPFASLPVVIGVLKRHLLSSIFSGIGNGTAQLSYCADVSRIYREMCPFCEGPIIRLEESYRLWVCP